MQKTNKTIMWMLQLQMYFMKKGEKTGENSENYYQNKLDAKDQQSK